MDNAAAQVTSSRHITATLRPRVATPRVARRLLRDLARGSSLPSRVIDNATFVLGELVTMSLQQVGGRIVVTAVIDDREITVRVHDDGSNDRALRHDRSAGATRQWHVVKRLASSWGYSRDDRQREVWATIRTERDLVAA
jgi:anti-sigma regulatory factor (Ser/Thr protein kinase)